MNTVDRIRAELQDLGFSPQILRIDGLGGDQAVIIDYSVKTGRYNGQTFKVGVAFQEAGYPEYPPHFIWVAGLLSPTLPAHSTGRYDGLDWSAFSVPPSDFWDGLPVAEKNMKTYLNRHMQRFWSQV